MKFSLFHKSVATALLVLQPLIGWPLLSVSVLASEPEGVSIVEQLGGNSLPDSPTQPTVSPGEFDVPQLIGTQVYPADVQPSMSSPEGVVDTKHLLQTEATDEDIVGARIFVEPIVPLDWPKIEGENAALSVALMSFVNRSNPDDVSALDSFIERFPGSRWRASVQTNAGIVRRRGGYFMEALQRFEDAWACAKGSTVPIAAGVAERAVGELAALNASFGRSSRVGELIAETEWRDVSAVAETLLEGSREGYIRMLERPDQSFRCGPFALNAVLCSNGDYVPNPEIARETSTSRGTSLKQLKELAERVGMDFVPARRSSEGEWAVPMVLHWRVGHFAAITRKVKDRYLIEDPTFGGEIWVTSDALDKEASGFGLVSSKDGKLPFGWTAISDEEAAEVWGRGAPPDREQGSCPKKAKDGCSGNRMAEFNFLEMEGTLEITDYPVGYTPPFGTPIEFMVRYRQLLRGQPVNLAYSNFGQSWISNWVSFIEVNESSAVTGGPEITLRSRTGGSDTFSAADFNPVTRKYGRSFYSGATFRKAAATRFEFLRPDGGIDVFAQPDGWTGRIFLKEVIDPQGNKTTINYDANLRITSIVDGLGQTTSITYMASTLGVSGSYFDPTGFYKIKRITDPFGRYAEFSYVNNVSQLSNIRDVIGINSSFLYDTDGFLKRLITPYGTTDFYKFTPAEDATARGLLAVLPDGSQEAIESYLSHTKASYYWDRKAMAMARGDRSKAVMTSWMIRTQGGLLVDAPYAIKKPFESEIFFAYPSQPDPINPDPNDPNESLHHYVGSFRQPSAIMQALDGGGVQIYRYEYNALGKVKKFIDPVGRTFTLSYAANNIDLMAIRDSNNNLLYKATYNDQHRPLTQTDASGNTTIFTYNLRGQITTETNPNGETTTFVYPANRLERIDGPLPGDLDRTVLGYDSFGRVSSVTRVTGPNPSTDDWTATFQYDALDRPTLTTYPDGTTEQNVFNRLDLVRSKDRLGRWTYFSVNAIGERVAMRDPSGGITRYEWCRCGALQGLTDRAGNITKWAYDEQGRLRSKTYADATVESYEYEANMSRLKKFIDGSGNVTNYEYYADNRLKTTKWDPAAGFDDVPDVTLTWDSNHPRIGTVSDSSATYSYSYKPYVTSLSGTPSNGRGQLESITNSGLANATLSFTYDKLGRVIDRNINGAANSSSWTFDAAGRFSSVINPLGTFIPAYENAAYGNERLASMSMPNGAVINYQWENKNGDFRLRQIENLGPSSVAISKHDYVTDAASRIIAWTQQMDAATPERYDFGYSRIDELESASLRNTSTQAIIKQLGYAYDSASNRVSTDTNGTVKQSTFNNVNEIQATAGGGLTRFQGVLNEPGTVTVGGNPAWMTGGTNFSANVNLNVGTNSVPIVATDASNNSRTNTFQVVIPATATRMFTFDDSGNLRTDGNKTFRWDAANRLVGITYSGNATTEFGYDAFGRRTKIVEKSSAGTVTSTKHFVWDGLEIAEERDASNAVIKQYFPQGFRQLDPVTLTLQSFFTTRDHLGSIREVLDNTGAIVARYDYDPYGSVTKLTGTVESDMLYTGHYYHQPSALFLAPYRAYDAELGRWLSRDPIGENGGINLYGYVSNNPINWTDPLGLQVDINLFPPTDPSHRIAQNYPSNPNAIIIASHGAASGVAYDTNALIDRIKKLDKYKPGIPIIFASCAPGGKPAGVGANNLLQTVSRSLPDNPVVGNNKAINWGETIEGKPFYNGVVGSSWLTYLGGVLRHSRAVYPHLNNLANSASFWHGEAQQRNDECP